MTNALAIPFDASKDGMAGYLRQVNEAPMLSAEEELDLATRFHENGDLEAARKLVMSHLRYVVKVARDFSGYGLPQADLVQEGNIGLMKAVKHFDPSRGVRLVAFAVHWIRAEIYEYVIRNWRIVKVATTKAQRKLFFNLRKSKNRLGWMNNGEVENLASDLSVSEKEVLEMESRLAGQDIGFDAGNDDDDDSAFAPSAWLADTSADPARLVADNNVEEDRHSQISNALAKLDDRSRDIVVRRWLSEDKPTLHDLADEYGVSAERIRQIEKKAMDNMKTHIEL